MIGSYIGTCTACGRQIPITRELPTASPPTIIMIITSLARLLSERRGRRKKQNIQSPPSGNEGDTAGSQFELIYKNWNNLKQGSRTPEPRFPAGSLASNLYRSLESHLVDNGDSINRLVDRLDSTTAIRAGGPSCVKA
jgi:hypothetical protein